MDSMPPLEALAGGDVSEELTAVLRSVADITAGGAPKFSPPVCRRLFRWIACRSYAAPLRELCHLIVAADRTVAGKAGAGGYEALFWGTGVARAAAFRAHFRANLRDTGSKTVGVERLDGGIRVTYGDGVFGVAYTRMPFLSALMEFLVSVFGYADLDAKLRGMPAGQLNKGAVDALANDLARQTYGYLSAHLPTVQSHRKFRAVMSFLRRVNTEADGGSVGPHSIDDEAVLAFWIFASEEANAEGGDFKSFRSVFRLMAAVRDALSAAAQAAAIEQARPIGSDPAVGETDPGAITPEAVDAALGPIHERRAPLDALRTAPASGIKFLKKTESDAIAPVIEFGATALALPLSVLRFQAMGGLQARLTEALRRGREVPFAMALRSEPDGATAPYGAFAGYVDHIDDHLRTVLLASFHHLVAARREEAVAVLLHLRPHIDLSPLAPIFDGPTDERDDDRKAGGAGRVVRLAPPAGEDRFMRTLTAGLDHCPDLVALIGEAGTAAKRMTRKGFKDADWTDADHPSDGRADACAAGSEALILIRQALMKFSTVLARLGRRHGGWEALYRSDHDIFAARFRALYGDNR